MSLIGIVLATWLPVHALGGHTVDKGILKGEELAAAMDVLGDYEGQWNSELTDNIYDDISRYELDRPILRVALDAQQHLRLTFFMDATAAAADEELDLLGFGCHSRVGDVLTLDIHRNAEAAGTEPRLLLDATFDFDWGSCPSRVLAVASNDLKVRIAANDLDRERIVSLALLRNVQADTKVYVNQDGVRREVKVRPKADSQRSVYNREMEYCVLSAVGEIEACFERESELKRFIVPFPFPGLSAAWYTKKTPKLEFESGKKLIYHEAVFRRSIAQ